MFSSERLKLARQRRRMSGKALAEKAGVTPVTISKVENGHQPEEWVAQAIAKALEFPRGFFNRGDVDFPDCETVSFRSLKRMSASERDAALAAGALGIELYEWIGSRFSLPGQDLIDLSKERNRPEIAARLLRQHWQLGERPIGNVLKLLEAKGVRVLSLSENTKHVDAYSFWHNEIPYIFLNQEKSAERSIFDSAHELGHLVLHFHAGAKNERGAEMQADKFAGAFLMPSGDVRSSASGVQTASKLILAKKRWKVSAMALAYQLHNLGMMTDWNYRAACIELGRRGYRSGEPVGVDRETSVVLSKVLTALWSKKQTKEDIAKALDVPFEEIEALVFGLAGPVTTFAGSAHMSLVG